jgi:hypothetical protein
MPPVGIIDQPVDLKPPDDGEAQYPGELTSQTGDPP